VIANLNAAGGLAVVMRSLEDLRRAVDQLLEGNVRP
jgi:hypothetical protein